MIEVVQRPAAGVARTRAHAASVEPYTGKHVAFLAAAGVLWGLFLYVPLTDAIARFGG